MAIPASAASAGTTYNSTATATAGYVSVAGIKLPVPDNSVTATDTSGPQSASLGIGPLEAALAKTPLGPSLHALLPTGLNVVTANATASSDGTSAACAGFLTGDCYNYHSQPITLSLSLADLPGLQVPAGAKSTSSHSTSSSKPGSSGLLPSGLLPSLGAKQSGSSGSSASSASSGSNPASSLAGYALVVTLSGPEAACAAGPPGSSGSHFTATESLASASVDITYNGKSVLPSGAIKVDVGNILAQLPPLTGQLNQLLGSSVKASPIDLTVNTGSTSGAGSGPATSATAGEVALGINGTSILDLVGAKVTCGPNAPAKETTKPTTTSGEKPLTGVQTDEGRSGSGAAPWIGGVAGTAALGAAAGGLTLWRRRRGLT